MEDRADAVVVGVLGLDGAVHASGAGRAVPVLFTLPIAEPTSGSGGRFAFALAPTPAQLARPSADDALIARDLLAPTCSSGDESTGAIAERSLSSPSCARALR